MVYIPPCQGSSNFVVSPLFEVAQHLKSLRAQLFDWYLVDAKEGSFKKRLASPSMVVSGSRKRW